MNAMALLAPKFLVLYTFILTGTYVHFRGKVRHKFQRQLLDHSTIMAPYNCFVYATSAVPNKPFLPEVVWRHAAVSGNPVPENC